jgi:hypothetical protein
MQGLAALTSHNLPSEHTALILPTFTSILTSGINIHLYLFLLFIMGLKEGNIIRRGCSRLGEKIGLQAQLRHTNEQTRCMQLYVYRWCLQISTPLWMLVKIGGDGSTMVTYKRTD